MKRPIFITMLVTILILVMGCTSGTTDSGDDGMITLTLEELAEFNGQDGKPAYVAYEGDIYDISDVNAWSGGAHYGQVAGTDITEALNNEAPHGPGRISLATKICQLVD